MEKQNGDEGFRALRLRPATSGDEPFLLTLFASTRTLELALMDWDETQKETFVAMQFNAQNRQYVMSYPEAQNSIILWNDDPVGRLLLDKGELEFTLVDVALLPAYRGSGIGSFVIQDIVKEAAATGKSIRLHVLSSNAAKRLYERLGFSQTGGDEVYFEMMWVPPAARSC
jgi:ribosomal protein S18 acetylase RimI-like enzyme